MIIIPPQSRQALTGSNSTVLQHSLPGPQDIYRQELENGIVVLARANFHSPSVVISGYLTAGALFESDDKLGLADFTASTLMRGSERRNFHQIYDALESVAASLGFESGTHTTGFSAKCLVEDMDLILDLMSEALLQPVFPADHVERVRARLLTSLAMRAQDTSEMASMTFDQIVYQGHPYSRPEDGYPDTIQAIQQADLVEFHRKFYGPCGMVMSVVGGIEPSRAFEKIASFLGDWRNPLQPDSPSLPPLPPLQQTIRRYVPLQAKSQADLVIGAAGPARTAPDYLPASLGNHILGQFGMMGRIGEVVRQRAGLAYYAGSGLAGGPGPGPWDVSAGVDPKDVDQVIDLIVQEIRRFTSEPVSQEELADSQANYIGRLPISLESNSGVAGALITLERYHLGFDYYLNYPQRVYSVTAEDILAAARRYLDPDRLAIAIAGPEIAPDLAGIE